MESQPTHWMPIPEPPTVSACKEARQSRRTQHELPIPEPPDLPSIEDGPDQSIPIARYLRLAKRGEMPSTNHEHLKFYCERSRALMLGYVCQERKLKRGVMIRLLGRTVKLDRANSERMDISMPSTTRVIIESALTLIIGLARWVRSGWRLLCWRGSDEKERMPWRVIGGRNVATQDDLIIAIPTGDTIEETRALSELG